MSYQERKARLARLSKGTMWESEHPEEKRIPEQVRSVSREVAQLLREKRNAVVPVRDRRGSWMERRLVRSVFLFGLCWRCARLPSGISENWMCLTASQTLSTCSRWFGNCILALWLAGEGCFLVHGSYVLLDAVMGYRSRRRRWSFKVSL